MPGLNPSRLIAVSCIFDFFGDDRLYRNYDRFRAKLPMPIVTVECVPPGRTHRIPDAIHVHGASALFLKENLWDIGRKHVPPEYDAIAFCDPDFVCAEDWASASLWALQTHDFVHPFQYKINEAPDGSDDFREWSGPGVAWVLRRDWIDRAGFYEDDVSGWADDLMVKALDNRIDRRKPATMIEGLRAWAAAAGPTRVAWLPLCCRHMWNGPWSARHYEDKIKTLCLNDYRPARDIRKNEFGVVELTDNESRLARWFASYFKMRAAA